MIASHVVQTSEVRLAGDRLESVREFRQFVVACLAGLPDPVIEDGRLVASELSTNTLHSRSALPGGKYTGRVEIGIDAVLIEVVDQGSDTESPEIREDQEDQEQMAESGRGLLICRHLGELETETTPGGGRRVGVRIPIPAVGAEATSTAAAEVRVTRWQDRKGRRAAQREVRRIIGELYHTPEPAVRGVLLSGLAEAFEDLAGWGRYQRGDQAKVGAWVESLTMRAHLARTVAATEHGRGLVPVAGLWGDRESWTDLARTGDHYARADLLIDLHDSILAGANLQAGGFNALATLNVVADLLMVLADTEQAVAYLAFSEHPEQRARRDWHRRLLTPVTVALVAQAGAAAWTGSHLLIGLAMAGVVYSLAYDWLAARLDPDCEPADHISADGVAVWCPGCEPGLAERQLIDSEGRYLR